MDLQVLGIDVVLLQSVDRCDNEDVKRKMLSNIIIVGGGLANFRGVATWLKNRLSTQMPQSFKGASLNRYKTCHLISLKTREPEYSWSAMPNTHFIRACSTTLIYTKTHRRIAQ